MASLFAPQWPSADDGSGDNADNSGGAASGDGGGDEIDNLIGSLENNAEAMNGDTKQHDGAPDMNPDLQINPAPPTPPAEDMASPSNAPAEGVDGIELTHDPSTGSANVAPPETEADEAGEQCQLWSAANPPDDTNDDDGGGFEINAGVFGDIWSTEAFALDAASPLKDLLDGNRFSLADLLAQDELLQELRGCEARLVEYFGTEDAVAGLVECLMVEVPGNGSREGRQRWCQEEEERRRREREGKEERLKGGETAHLSPSLSRSTVVDASSPRQDDPTVEATWNSPDKKSPPGEWLLGSSPNSIKTEMVQKEEEPQRTVEEEYDVRFVRYPYMACEVLCSEVGATLDVLIDGYVDELGSSEINDEEDSLLGDAGGARERREVKMDMEMEGEHDSGEAMSNAVVPPPPPPSLSPQISPPKLPPIKTPPATPNVQPPPSPASAKPPTPRRRILDLLFAVLIDAPPATLDDRRAGYFEKVLNVLFRKRPQAMSDYMNTSLIVTVESTDMAKRILGNAGGALIVALCPKGPGEGNASEDIERSSSYVSFSQQVHSPHSNGSDSDAAMNRDVAGAMGKFPSPDAPPMVMCALFDHLHSYSIMHIVQRLLLPSPARQQHKEAKAEADLALFGGANKDATSAAADSEAEGRSVDDSDNPNSAINDQFMNALNQMNGMADDDEDEEMDEDDPANHIFQCDWSEQPRFALELLLKRLEGDTSSFLVGYGFPVGYDADSCQRIDGDGDAESAREEEAEASLSCAQHASEVLVTIIQNSALDSPVMKTLSADPTLRRIIDLILVDAQPEFAPHESLMTCGMTALESLVLQLGGYGAVAPCADAEAEANARQDGANASALIHHVPTLLTRLSSLLTHPITETWKAPSQHKVSRPLLGTSRLRILRLLEALVLLGDPAVDAALQGSDALEGALDLFWKFEWCSMLHQSAANMLVHVFEGGEGRHGLQEYFLGRCNLLGRLMDSFCGETACAPNTEAVPNGSAKPSSTEEAMSSEMMLAMKKLYQSERTTSMESEHGSECSDPSDPAPVSEDDVDSVMEKESQDGGNPLIEVASEEKNDDAPPEQPMEDPNSGDSPPSSEQQPCPSHDQSRTPFRKGYMGHVIIICQALVHVCNATTEESGDPSGSDDTGASAMEEAECLLRSPPSMDDSVPGVTNFETAAVQSPMHHEDNDMQSPNGSKKRKDRSPVRDGTEDDVKRPCSPDDSGSPNLSISSPISPISSVQSSPSLGVLPPSANMNGEAHEVMSIDRILQQHPLYEKWQAFVTSSLASEMSVQSTPLGEAQNPAFANELGGQALPSAIEDNSDSDFLGSTNQGPSGVSAIGGMAIAGGIDMDENDLDIAASMMEALSLPPAATNGGASAQPVGHNRRRGVSLLGGGEVATEASAGVGNFGSVIQRPGAFKDYVYDDPLGGGGLHPFDGAETEDTTGGSGSGSHDDDDDFMSDAMVVSRDGGVTKQGSEEDQSGSKSDNEAGDDNSSDEEDVPVMDLFAGTFDANFADFDAFDSKPSDDSFKSAEDAFATVGTSSEDAADGFEKTPFDMVDSLSGDGDDEENKA